MLGIRAEFEVTIHDLKMSLRAMISEANAALNVIITIASFPGASKLHKASAKVGEWLSLVEHLVRDQGVGGSNPLSPTILFKHLNLTSGFPSTSTVSKL